MAHGVSASVAHPIDNKKAKADKYGLFSSVLVQATIDKCLAEVTSFSKQNLDTFKDSWTYLMDKHSRKLALSRWKPKRRHHRRHNENQGDLRRVTTHGKKDEGGCQDVDR